MNTYSKYCPNVYLAKCEEQYQKGDEIIVETRRGKENECIVHNLIYERDGHFFYSITRKDGFNSQVRAQNKAEKLKGYATNADKKSDEAYNRSNKDRDFLSLGEPIKVGHHSEKRHRKAIDDAHRNMGKSIELSDKADDYRARAEYWENQTNKIDLSMPESIDYFQYQMEKAEKFHAEMKAGKIEKRHSFSLTYAKKDANEMKKKYELALKLWGDNDQE